MRARTHQFLRRESEQHTCIQAKYRSTSRPGHICLFYVSSDFFFVVVWLLICRCATVLCIKFRNTYESHWYTYTREHAVKKIKRFFFVILGSPLRVTVPVCITTWHTRNTNRNRRKNKKQITNKVTLNHRITISVSLRSFFRFINSYKKKNNKTDEKIKTTNHRYIHKYLNA